MSGYVDIERSLGQVRGAIVVHLGVAGSPVTVKGLGAKMSRISGKLWREQLT
jgi:hypothetical protein